MARSRIPCSHKATSHLPKTFIQHQGRLSESDTIRAILLQVAGRMMQNGGQRPHQTPATALSTGKHHMIPPTLDRPR